MVDTILMYYYYYYYTIHSLAYLIILIHLGDECEEHTVRARKKIIVASMFQTLYII